MRPSKRTIILEAALRVIARDGVSAVTYETVGQESGLSKAGLVYHFPSRDALLLGLQEHLAAQWETALTEHAAKPADQLTAAERSAAYARVATQSATPAELLLIVEASTDDTLSEPWRRVMQRWAPSFQTDTSLTDRDATQLIAHLAADGLWLYDTLTGSPLPPEMRAELSERIAALASSG